MSERENLMRDVARTVQTDVRRRQLLPEIQARLAALDEKQQRRPARAVWGWSMAGMAACCAAGIAFYVMKLQPVSFAVDGATSAGATGAVGQKLAAPNASALSLRFSTDRRSRCRLERRRTSTTSTTRARPWRSTRER